jgi:thiol-disulfide isomerase/thioredoxin
MSFVGTPVTQLHKKDFKNGGKFTIHKNQKGKDGLILFYLDYCGYCKMMKPEFIKLGSLAKKKGMFVGAIDGMDQVKRNNVLFEEMGIQGVPDIRYVSKDGRIDDEKYMGERTLKDFLSYIKKKSSKKQSGGAKKKVVKKSASKKKKVVKKSASKKKKVVKKSASKKKKVVKKSASKKKVSKRTRKSRK